ncbi:MAG: hypothetical protein ACFFBL_09875, partial [Promethearchaeota archaeon]
MRRTIPHFVFMLTITCLLCSTIFVPAQAAPPAGWSGDASLGFLLDVNGVNAVTSNATNPIQLDVSDPILINVTVATGTDLTILTATFIMTYMSVPIISTTSTLNQIMPDNTTAS